MMYYLLLAVLFYAMILFGYWLGLKAERRRRGNGYQPRHNG